MNKWQKVMDSETQKLFKETCKWKPNPIMPNALGANVQFKNGKKAQLQYLKRIIQISVIVGMSTMRTFQNTMILICLLVAVRVRIGVLQEKTEKQQVRVLDSICLCSL